MTDHPITPPPELVREWEAKYDGHMPEWVLRHVAAEAAQWGADQCGEVNEAKLQQARDQELAACNNWLVLNGYGEVASRLYAALRPMLAAFATPSCVSSNWRIPKADQITLKEALELVEFDPLPEGWRVKHVNGDVCGSVNGDVWENVWGDVGGTVCRNVRGHVGGTIGGRLWKFIETPKEKLKRLIKEGADQDTLLAALNQLEDSNG